MSYPTSIYPHLLLPLYLQPALMQYLCSNRYRQRHIIRDNNIHCRKVYLEEGHRKPPFRSQGEQSRWAQHHIATPILDKTVAQF